MEGYYLEIRNVHIGAVIASGSLFLIRALAVNFSAAAWPMTRPVRTMAYAIDTVLLAAALMLAAIVRQYPFVDGWLTVKVVLLVGYIFLGYVALRGRTAPTRLASLAGAVITFGCIVSVARAHRPLGFLAGP